MTASWKPIETAPKDGTAVLVWDKNARRQGQCGAWAYLSRAEPAPAVVVAKWHHSGWASDLVEFESGWESTGSYTIDLPVNPTHWMPLPGPPTQDP